MEYSIDKLAKLAHISTRTLRYYDEINLLKPARINSTGYRIYGTKEVNLLQQILLYKELGLELEMIKKIIYTPEFNYQTALTNHLDNLQAKKAHIDELIENVKNSLNAVKKGVTMSDQEKFKGLKKQMINDNEAKYGKEIRQKYGDKEVDDSNKKLMNLTKESHDYVEELNNQILSLLTKALIENNPESELGQKIAKLHQEWIKYFWTSYNKMAHINLVNMYVEDERFSAFYDKAGKGATVFLKDAVTYYLSK